MISERVFTLSLSERIVEIVVQGERGVEALGPVSGWSVLRAYKGLPDVRLDVRLRRATGLSMEPSRTVPVNTVESTAQQGGGFLHFSPGAFEGALVPVDGQLCGTFEVVNSGRALEALLKITVSQLFRHLGGVLFHASAVRHGGSCFVFLGPSGSGKTTIATSLKAGGESISLDRVGVVPDKVGGWAACATPFSDTSGASTLVGPPVPVQGLVFIHQAKSTWMEPLKPLSAMRNMIKHVTTYGRTRETDLRLLDVAERMALDLECSELHFTKDERFWSLLNRSTKETL
jgi:hypothetical protein